jgi:hypothetical protein
MTALRPGLTPYFAQPIVARIFLGPRKLRSSYLSPHFSVMKPTLPHPVAGLPATGPENVTLVTRGVLGSVSG